MEMVGSKKGFEKELGDVLRAVLEGLIERCPARGFALDFMCGGGLCGECRGLFEADQCWGFCVFSVREAVIGTSFALDFVCGDVFDLCGLLPHCLPRCVDIDSLDVPADRISSEQFI